MGELHKRLQQQQARLSVLLQAVNNFNLRGRSYTVSSTAKQTAILEHVQSEKEFVAGIDSVFQAVIQMQTLMALEMQRD